jgi:hypothetical protein
MKIDCYISEGCSSEEALNVNLREALKLEETAATIKIHRMSDAEAKRLGLMGSPSVFIDGIDILPAALPGFS